MPPVAAAFAAVGAGAAGIAEIATVVSAVGSGLSVVGAVTGSKDLAKIGGTLALAGGVTSLATSAFGAGAATAAGEVASSAAGIGEGLGGSGGAYGAASDFGANTGLGYTGEATTTGLSSAANKASGLINQVGSIDAPAPQNQQPQDLLPVSQSTGGVKPPSDISSNGFLTWFKSLDPRTQSTILQSGAGAVGGLFDGWTQEQKLALDRERMALDREKYNKGLLNASAQPVINFAPTGLINAPRTS